MNVKKFFSSVVQNLGVGELRELVDLAEGEIRLKYTGIVKADFVRENPLNDAEKNLISKGSFLLAVKDYWLRVGGSKRVPLRIVKVICEDYRESLQPPGPSSWCKV